MWYTKRVCIHVLSPLRLHIMKCAYLNTCYCHILFGISRTNLIWLKRKAHMRTNIKMLTVEYMCEVSSNSYKTALLLRWFDTTVNSLSFLLQFSHTALTDNLSMVWKQRCSCLFPFSLCFWKCSASSEHFNFIVTLSSLSVYHHVRSGYRLEWQLEAVNCPPVTPERDICW